MYSQLANVNVKMYILSCMVIVLHLADGVKPANLTRLFSRNGDENFIKNQSGNERMTVPRFFQKSTSDSNSLSFAFTLPVQRKTLPFNSNASKKQLYPPFAALQELANVKKIGKGNALTDIPNERLPGKEMGVNTTQNNYIVKTLNLVGIPLHRSNPINKGVSVSRLGTPTVSSSLTPRLGWKAKPRANGKYVNKATSPLKQFQTQSGLRANTPLDEEIIVMGEPLIFTKGNKKVSYAQKGNVSSDTRGGNSSQVSTHYNSSGAHFYNPAAPVELQAQGERVQGAHLTNQSPDHVGFHDNSTISNGPKNSLSKTYDYPHGGFKNSGSNQQQNQLPTQQRNASQARYHEEEDEYEMVGITDHGRHNNKSVYPSNFDEESLKQETFGHQSGISEQNQTELVYENDHDSIGGHGFGDRSNLTDYQENVATNESYDNQENKVVNTDELAEAQENSTSLQLGNDGSEEKEIDNTQTINDNTSNLEQNQESKEDEQFAAGNPVAPLSNQRYVPVDEFGSPLYGTETDNYFQREALVAHNKYRAIHRAPPLELSEQLSREAEDFAKNLAKMGVARHEVWENLKREGEGDNVARGCSEWGGLTATGAVHRWYTQVCFMDWSKRTIQPNTKNFMQLIWKGTSHMGIGRAFGMRQGLPCTFIVARYTPGTINSYGLESNIDKGLFVPSYCNAERDEGLMSTGFPSSFFLESINKQNDQSSAPSDDQQTLSSSTNGVSYFPLSSWEKNIDAQEVHDIVKDQTDSEAANSFLPRINLAEGKSDEGKNDQEVPMVLDDNAWRRVYEPSKEKGGTRSAKTTS